MFQRLSRQCPPHKRLAGPRKLFLTAPRPYSSLNAASTLKSEPRRATSRSSLAPGIRSPTRPRFIHNDALPRSDAQKSTIYALSTPPGRGGVGVVRISGPDALKEVWGRMVKPYAGSTSKDLLNPTPWKLYRCRVVHPSTGETIDDGLAVYFKGPKSFTSEDVVELHLHSGRAVIAAALSALSTLPTLRSAEPGEFTRRAYLNGRLDLTQAEGLKDLIDAETEGQRKVAVRAAEGSVRQKFDELRKGVISALAKVEALIDFGEGEEIEEGVYEDAKQGVRRILDTVQGYLHDHRRGELLRSGIRLAIFGPPNAGKSSLLNFLAQREAAIVTPIPGTTRDVMELTLDIGGLPVIIADTAGLRKTEDVVEKIGVERARQAVQNADISICVLSLPDLLEPPKTGTSKDLEHWRELVSPDTYCLFNKSDLLKTSPEIDTEALRMALVPSSPPSSGKENSGNQIMAWRASLIAGSGADEFLTGFSDALKRQFGLSDSTPGSSSSPEVNPIVITRSRHRDHLQSASRHLEMFLEYGPDDVVFAAEELRYAATAIGKVTGAIGVEDILDAVFRDFCIGK
ncbi:tRNA modification GTPase TrmE [Coprinellus micaceus]|uniref:tRNA modification GTPase TrmE n=1 Tax=Coprinellus micaceus TaxID=71717 RepID=A0A4Y7T5K5_COPMI|nr:tRNA modification GTPase TrmE [Coprinellus micaceus]